MVFKCNGSLVRVAQLILIFGLLVPSSSGAAQPSCGDGSEPFLIIETSEGPIVARLLEDAAPGAVARLIRLANGPLFHPDILDDSEFDAKVGYFDGLAFGFANPHVEIISDARSPAEAITIDTELDARALGLDHQLIADAGEAMDIAQMELAPAYKRGLKPGRNTKELAAWMSALYETHDAAFLVGTSRMAVNEALGYQYTEGLASQPVVRGALMLKPISPRKSSPQISIALTDLPRRTGRWMVVGQVVDGLERADRISSMPLADPSLARSRHSPVNPVIIRTTRLECRRQQ